MGRGHVRICYHNAKACCDPSILSGFHFGCFLAFCWQLISPEALQLMWHCQSVPGTAKVSLVWLCCNERSWCNGSRPNISALVVWKCCVQPHTACRFEQVDHTDASGPDQMTDRLKPTSSNRVVTCTQHCLSPSGTIMT